MPVTVRATAFLLACERLHRAAVGWCLGSCCPSTTPHSGLCDVVTVATCGPALRPGLRVQRPGSGWPARLSCWPPLVRLPSASLAPACIKLGSDITLARISPVSSLFQPLSEQPNPLLVLSQQGRVARCLAWGACLLMSAGESSLRPSAGPPRKSGGGVFVWQPWRSSGGWQGSRGCLATPYLHDLRGEQQRGRGESGRVCLPTGRIWVGGAASLRPDGLTGASRIIRGPMLSWAELKTTVLTHRAGWQGPWRREGGVEPSGPVRPAPLQLGKLP